MSCSLKSTKDWLMKPEQGFISKTGRVLKSLQPAINYIVSHARKKYGKPIPDSLKYNDVLYTNKQGNIGFYKPFFEWVDIENNRIKEDTIEAREQNILDAERAGIEYTDRHLFQVKGSEGPAVSDEALKVIKSAAQKMGIRLNSLTEYAKAHPEIDVKDINGLADLFNGVVAVAHGMENVTLTEEIIHIATAILEQTNPHIITKLISKINKYQIYQETYDKYKGRAEYQLPNGKPDIRKIKKEALDKLLVQVLVAQVEQKSFSPELSLEDNRNWLKRTWDSILDSIRALFHRSDVDLLKKVGDMLAEGDVGGTMATVDLQGLYLQTIQDNAAVNLAYDTITDVHNKMELVPEVKDAQGNIVDKRHYMYDGNRVAKSVTEKVKESKTFPVQDTPDKMMWGIEGHKYLELYIKNNLIDSKGYALSQKGKAQISSPLNSTVQGAIQNFADGLIESYPVGTRFLTEVMVVNENYKGGLAGTVDFMAIVPTKDKNGNDDFIIDTLDWKFTSFDANKYQDLSPGKQKDWKSQMSEYTKTYQTGLYKFKKSNTGKARMIPMISHYSYNIPHAPNSGLYLTKIEVGDVNNPKETKLYLLPVPTDQESTSNPMVDQLVRGLELQRNRMYKKLRNPQERFEKDAELAAITSAIKRLRVQLDFDPLYSVGLTATNNIDKKLEEYNKLDFEKLSPEKLDFILGELLDFQNSLEKFIDLDQVYSDYIGKDSKDLTKEELTTRDNISSVSRKAKELKGNIVGLQQQFTKDLGVKRGVTTEETKEDILLAEKKINWFSYSFMEGTRLSQKIIRLASNLLLNSKKLVDVVINRKIRDYNKMLLELEDQAKSMGVKAFDLIGKVNENDLQLINKIKREYYVEQREAVKNQDKQFFKDNMDIPAYKAMVAKILKERYDIIDNTVFTQDQKENDARKKLAKSTLKNKIDIFSDGFYGYNAPYFLYIYRQNFLEEKHYSEEFKQLKNNAPAYAVWKYFMELNKEARDLGYLTDERQSFFPLIEATSLQKLQQTKDYGRQMGDFFKDVFTSRINESLDYNVIDPETGEVKKSIPKYFTKTDKNVEQLSRDLNMVGSLWIKSVEMYRANRELENTMHTLHMVESSKGHIIESGGQTVYDGTNIATKTDVNPNADILQTIIDDGLYNLRESTTSIGNRAIDFSSQKLAKTEEGKEKLGLNARKTINSANDLVRLLALGLKYTLGFANYVGTQFQTFIKSGEFYTFKEYEKNHGKVMFSNFGTLTNEEKGLLDLFVPLNEDIALETRRKAAWKEGYLKYLSTWNFTDTLMLTMQFPEKKLQFANAISFLDNTMIEDGKLVNIRQYLKQKDRTNRKDLSFEERRELRKTFEKRVADLKNTRALKKVVKVSDNGVDIPGISDAEIAEYRTKIIDYNRTLNGMMDENDKMGFRRDTMFSSFMMFKSWIPKLVYVRTQELKKNIQTGNWEYGRMRAFVKTLLYKDMSSIDLEKEANRTFVTRWNMNLAAAINNVSDIIKGTDRGMEILNKILYDKKMAYFKETGQHLEISEEEFQDIMRDAIINQFKEIGVLMSVMGSYIGAAMAEPPEDASKLEINRYKLYYKMVNKVADEITFYYNPTSTEAILQGTFIPAFSLLSKTKRFGSQLAAETWGHVTDDKDLVKDSHPTKYFFNLVPILSHAQHEYLPYIDPELAKEMGIVVTKESRKK